MLFNLCYITVAIAMDRSSKTPTRHTVALINTPKQGMMEMSDSEPFGKKVHDKNRRFRPLILIYKGNCGA